MYLTITVLVILAICVSMTMNEGMWSNTLTLFNVVFSAIVASNYYEPMADWFDGMLPSFAYFVDFLSLWSLFCISLIVTRVLTDLISKTKVRFKLPVEHAGRIGMAFLSGWVFVCFFMFSIHMAPLARNCFGKGFAKTPTSANFLFSPDRLWLGFMQSRSENAMSTTPPNVFDENSEFIYTYGQRRENFSKTKTLLVKNR